MKKIIFIGAIIVVLIEILAFGTVVWVATSVGVSALKSAKEECSITYQIEKSFNVKGNLFCP